MSDDQRADAVSPERHPRDLDPPAMCVCGCGKRADGFDTPQPERHERPRAEKLPTPTPAEDWSAMCNESAPWQTPNAFTLCRLPAGHGGDHERYGRTWQRDATPGGDDGAP